MLQGGPGIGQIAAAVAGGQQLAADALLPLQQDHPALLPFRGGQGRQAAADDVGGFVVHALGLFGAGKGFIVAAGIIHGSFLLSIFLLWPPAHETRSTLGAERR